MATPPATSASVVDPVPAPAAPPVAAAAVTPVTPTPAPVAPAKFEWALHGFIRGGYTFVQRDEQSYAVGQTGGFRLQNTRLVFAGGYGESVKFDLSLDHDEVLDSKTNAAPIRPALRDAAVRFALGEGMYVKVGQFKTPTNGELLLEDGEVPFTRRSVITDGVQGDEVVQARDRLGLDRQIGAMFGAKFGDLELQLGAFNGNGANQGRNDNRLPAVALRVAYGVGKSVIGLSGSWNDRTVGKVPALQDERDFSGEIDAMLHLGDLSIFAMGIATSTSFVTTQIPARLAWGAVGSVGYAIHLDDMLLEPALRGALYEPTNLVEQSGLIDLTAGVNFLPWKTIPVRFQLNGLMRVERASRLSPNNILECVAQANF